MDVSLNFVGLPGAEPLFETASVYPASPDVDVVLIQPTESGAEIPSLKLLHSGERYRLAERLAESFLLVLVGPLPPAYLENPALMDRVTPSKAMDSPLEARRDVIWSCPHPGIKGIGNIQNAARSAGKERTVANYCSRNAAKGLASTPTSELGREILDIAIEFYKLGMSENDIKSIILDHLGTSTVWG